MSTLRTNAIVDAAGGNTTTINGYYPLEQGGGTETFDAGTINIMYEG